MSTTSASLVGGEVVVPGTYRSQLVGGQDAHDVVGHRRQPQATALAVALGTFAL